MKHIISKNKKRLSLLHEEYSDKIKDYIIKKWQAVDNKLTADQILDLMSKFEIIKSSPKLKSLAPNYIQSPKDISQYKSYEDCKSVTDKFTEQEVESIKQELEKSKQSSSNKTFNRNYKQIIDDLFKVWSKENITKSTVEYYVKRFPRLVISNRFKPQLEYALKNLNIDKRISDEILSGNNYKDLQRYTIIPFRVFETVIDSFPYSKEEEAERRKVINAILSNTKNTLLAHDGPFSIHAGLTKNACVKLSDGFGWCIGDNRSGMYYKYRSDAAIYFIFDNSKGKPNRNDATSAMVLQVGKITKPYSTEIFSYLLTFANNDGDMAYHTWSEVLNQMKTRGASKQLIDFINSNRDLFVYEPMSEEEAKTAILDGRSISDELFLTLSPELKIMYMATKKPIGKLAFDGLTNELKNEYIRLGNDISLEWIKNSDNLKKSYGTISIRLGRPIPFEIYKYLKKEDLDQYYEFLKKPSNFQSNAYSEDVDLFQFITFDIIEQYFPERIDEYIEMQFSQLGKDAVWAIEEDAIKYLNPADRELYTKIFKPANNILFEVTATKSGKYPNVYEYYWSPTSICYSLDEFKELPENHQRILINLAKYCIKYKARAQYFQIGISTPEILDYVATEIKSGRMSPEYEDILSEHIIKFINNKIKYGII